MIETIKEINDLMREFYFHWERENTDEMFLLLNGSNETREIEFNIDKNNKRLEKIENIFNNKDNFNSIIDNWNSIDLKMLDTLVYSFEIDIEEFKERLNNSDANRNTKEFFIEL